MACAHPLISVYSKKGESSGKNVTLPAVLKAPIRPDIKFVHTNLHKNRLPYAVRELAGHQTRTESWFRGSGTCHAGQVAFRNTCCGGCMFSPTKTWHHWHHREVPELLLVVKYKVEVYKKTKEAVLFLKKPKARNDIRKIYAFQSMRAGKGKMKIRHHIRHKEPCIICNEDNVDLYGTWHQVASLKTPRKKIHQRVLRRKPLKNLRIMLKLNSYAKTMCRNTILHQANNHKLQMDKASGSLRSQPVIRKKGKKATGVKKQKKPLVGKKKAAATKKSAADKTPKENKPTREEKKPAA
ncbi:unnamed protein product [Nyctereutes procyonoides]|uniref:(raccoon dog) hypothetical protein n=1 Tax=Nyctereutes procyonoides TaxID=34880 RepID=A0A811ZVF7_NYCPR|nr:unnamed protein product [Nyctereutes procyonoides]